MEDREALVQQVKLIIERERLLSKLQANKERRVIKKESLFDNYLLIHWSLVLLTVIVTPMFLKLIF